MIIDVCDWYVMHHITLSESFHPIRMRLSTACFFGLLFDPKIPNHRFSFQGDGVYFPNHGFVVSESGVCSFRIQGFKFPNQGTAQISFYFFNGGSTVIFRTFLTYEMTLGCG